MPLRSARRLLTRLLPLAVVVCALGLSACDDTVDPFIESSRYFTLFGNLDMRADTQFVRVIPIADSLDTETDAPLPVTVRSTDLVTGEVQVWRDSVITFDNGVVGHVFFAPLRVQPARTYRFEVEADDGRLTSAETTLPALPEAVVETPVRFGSAYSQPVRWVGLENEPFRVETTYRFLRGSSSPFTDVTVLYDSFDRGEDGQADWETLVRLTQDRRDVEEVIADPSQLLFMGVGMRITVLDDQFVPPGGVFDREVLVQPGTFSNVENGFGFLGSIGRFSTEWVLPTTVTDALGYVAPAGAAKQLTTRPLVRAE